MRLLFVVVASSFLLCGTNAGQFEMKTSRHHVSNGDENANQNGMMILTSAGIPVESTNYNIVYLSNITIGTPPVTFTVIMDTGSSVLWVPHKGCTLNDGNPKNCPNKHVYDESKSSTSVATGQTFKIQYGIGSTKGVYFKDKVAFGDGNTTPIKFKNLIEFGAGDTLQSGDTGILGLCFIPPGTDSPPTSIVQELIDEDLLDDPIFTVYYKRCAPNVISCDDGGTITFGSEDKKNCGKVVGWTEKIPRSQTHWQFALDEISVGNYKFTQSVPAVTDTGSSHLFISRDVYNGIVKELNAESNEDGTIHAVKCSQNVEINLKINGVQYTIPMSSLVHELYDNKGKRNGYCQLMLYPKDMQGVFILGDPWVRAYCQVHDWNSRKVGFAKVLNPDTYDPTGSSSTLNVSGLVFSLLFVFYVLH